MLGHSRMSGTELALRGRKERKGKRKEKKEGVEARSPVNYAINQVKRSEYYLDLQNNSILTQNYKLVGGRYYFSRQARGQCRGLRH